MPNSVSGTGRETTCFSFDNALHGESNEAFNIERAPFDTMMLDAARDAGVEVLGGTVKRIIRLKEGDVAVDVDGQTLTGRYLLDASGQTTLLAKHLGMRRAMEHHRKVAYFGHFENVKRLEGKAEGHPTVAMCDEGWFWMINIDERRTSIGMVLDADIAKTIDAPASGMLSWGIERCPMVRERVASAVFPEKTHTIADFSYYCRPYAGKGYFLVGDAAFFLDPIFSSGICLGMDGAVKVAELVEELLAGLGGATLPDGRRPRTPAKIRRDYLPCDSWRTVRPRSFAWSTCSMLTRSASYSSRGGDRSRSTKRPFRCSAVSSFPGRPGHFGGASFCCTSLHGSIDTFRSSTGGNPTRFGKHSPCPRTRLSRWGRRLRIPAAARIPLDSAARRSLNDGATGTSTTLPARRAARRRGGHPRGDQRRSASRNLRPTSLGRPVVRRDHRTGRIAG